MCYLYDMGYAMKTDIDLEKYNKYTLTIIFIKEGIVSYVYEYHDLYNESFESSVHSNLEDAVNEAVNWIEKQCD